MIKTKKRTKIFLVVFIILIIILAVIYSTVDNRANILLASTADAKVKAKITGIANESVIKAFNQYPELSKLVSVGTDENGNVSHVIANSAIMNDLAYKTSQILLNYISKLNSMEISINWSAVICFQVWGHR